MSLENKNALLRRVQVYTFVVFELNLYLNTHPTDQKALEYFQKYKDLKAAAVTQYIAKYGPIVAQDVASDTTWSWIDSPWPWEREV